MVPSIGKRAAAKFCSLTPPLPHPPANNGALRLAEATRLPTNGGPRLACCRYWTSAGHWETVLSYHSLLTTHHPAAGIGVWFRIPSKITAEVLPSNGLRPVDIS